MTDEITVYSDYVCPFCYLGRAAMEQYLDGADEPPEVEWHVFDLRGYKRAADGSIDHDVDDGKDDDYFDQVRENVARLREEYDVEMLALDDLPDDVDSWDAQQAALGVRRHEGEAAFRRFHDAAFDALWQDGRDIGDPDVVADLAESVDLDPEVVRGYTADDDLEAALNEAFASADRAGVTGVPTFAYGEHAARGAVPPAQLRRLVEGQ